MQKRKKRKEKVHWSEEKRKDKQWETKQANCVNTCARKMESENKELPVSLTVYEPAQNDRFVVRSVTEVLHRKRCVPDHTNHKLNPQRHIFLTVHNNN